MITVRRAVSVAIVPLLISLVFACKGVRMKGEAPLSREVVFYVATNGNDEWSGRLPEPNAAATDGPFATIERARQAVWEVKRKGLRKPVTVIVRGGIYELRETLRFTQEDGGTRDCPITYQAATGEKVVLHGGVGIKGWEHFRDGIYRADLKKQGLAGVSFHQLFYKGKRQILARYPNFDEKHPRSGGLMYVDDEGYVPREQLFYKKGTIPWEKWGDISQAELVCYCGNGWNFAITPIIKVDTKQCLITFRKVRNFVKAHNRFFIQNVLGALDAPGEWYLDGKNGVLYFMPPDGKPADGEVVVPVVDNLIEVRGTIPYPHGYLNVKFQGSRDEFPMPDDAPPDNPVRHLAFKGFRLECARQDGIRLIGAESCAVIGNRVTNVGGLGINLGGVEPLYPEVGNPRLSPPRGVAGGVAGAGQDFYFQDPCRKCRVAGNDVWSVGSDGIFLYGTANIAENNHVYNIGLFDKDCPCINVFGEENIVRRNTLHDVPRCAIFLKGVDNIIELNLIHHAVYETPDMGSIRMCQRNLKLRGNIIRFNKILDTIGYGFSGAERRYLSPYYSWGIYLDDFTCGTTIYGNIIARAGRGGVMVHGGSDNIIENNIIVNAGSYQFENVPIRDVPVSGNKVRRNIFFYDGRENLVYRCTRWMDGSVEWERNLIFPHGGEVRVQLGRDMLIEGWKEWRKRGFDEGSVVADPLFENPDADDYRLKPDSPAWKLGFERIPVEKIGCYRSEERATFPVCEDEELVREEPILYVPEFRPLEEDFERDMAGRRPRHGDVKSYPRAPLVVTNEKAASGKHSLKFVDAPNLPLRWAPRIFYQLSYTEGKVRFSAEFYLDGKFPPYFGVDFRQYTDTGGGEYLSGPNIYFTPDGNLCARGKLLAKVPFDEWFKVEIETNLGEAASQLTLTLRGREPQRFTVPHVSREFRKLERIVISSLANKKAVFYVDNIRCVPVR